MSQDKEVPFYQPCKVCGGMLIMRGKYGSFVTWICINAIKKAPKYVKVLQDKESVSIHRKYEEKRHG